MLKKFLSALQLFLIIIAAAAAAVIGFYFYQSASSEAEIKEIRIRTEDNASDSEESDPYTEDGILKKYSGLYKENPDLRGWLKADGTPIDYPVLQADDNEFYIRHSFYKEYRYSGIPFADFQCSFEPMSDNIIIYGHNMKNGTMFAGLSSYKEKSFFQKYGIIHFDTLKSEGSYKVAAVFYTHPESFSYHTVIDFKSPEDFEKFAEKVKQLELYDTGVELNYGDKLLTLSTCSYNSKDERLVIVAKRL